MRSAVQQYTNCSKVLAVGIFLFLLMGQTQAQAAGNIAETNQLKAFSAALGLESLTEYSAILNSVGFILNRNLGIVGSYQELEAPKFLGGRSAEETATRVNSRIAFDVFTSLKGGTRVYGRFGMYLWDVNLRFNYNTLKMNFSHGGASQLLGVGSSLRWKSFFTNIDFEYYSSSRYSDESEIRLMINFSTKLN